MSAKRKTGVVLRTDAGSVIGEFKNVGEAERHAETLDRGLNLVICGRDGIVLSRRFPVSK